MRAIHDSHGRPRVKPHILERPEHPISRTAIDPNALKVLYRLINAGHTAYLVGGGVRDLMLGRKPKDFDIGTSAHPNQVRQLFRNSRLIGRRFRLAHVFFGSQNIEVATFRRHAEEIVPEDELPIRQDNTFGTPEEDALRRDFTVNALFYDPASFRVIDYVGGRTDLGAGLIRTVGDPEVRMLEDPVRMIRAVRFAAKLGFEIEAGTRRAIERHRAELVQASIPRLVEEIFRTLGSETGFRALALMEKLGMLEVVLPRLSYHLRSSLNAMAESATLRNMAALGTVAESGAPLSHQSILAGLFLDFYLGEIKRRHPHLVADDLVEELRGHGFSRGDTERMRLQLDAVAWLMTPGRRTRHLVNRQYFTEARRLYELTAPGYGADPAALDRFLASKPEEPCGRRRWDRRRRRRRRGRSFTRGSLPAGGRSSGTAPTVAHLSGLTGSPRDRFD